MFIRPLSDVHNEFSIYNVPELPTDARTVLVLAGDIALADRVNTTLVPFLDNLSDRFQDIMYIPGNHEYYHSSLTRADEKLFTVCKRYGNVHYMQTETMVIEDVMFIGATLWTDLNRGDPIVIWHADSQMNDYEVIRTGPPAEPYRRKAKPIDTIGLNMSHRAFLEEALKSPEREGLKTVVMTHHQPLTALNKGHYPAGPLDYAYYNTGLDDLVLDYGPDVWISGHTHHPNDETIGRTRFVRNPRGYTRNPDGSEGLGFDGGLVIEL